MIEAQSNTNVCVLLTIPKEDADRVGEIQEAAHRWLWVSMNPAFQSLFPNVKVELGLSYEGGEVEDEEAV